MDVIRWLGINVIGWLDFDVIDWLGLDVILQLDDGSEYFYTIKDVEVTNILGTATSVLQEYFVTNSSGEKLVLHRTNDGNWYEIQGINSGVEKGILLALKLKFDSL